ncbi:MAG: 2-C-methyl-D-erythritol 2,4-cyclodiphosphate synthase [Ignavibacteriales bacterium]|nr:2-C-methyl-D-erythritol 2,4-cyclodiphosphate synthase [Ignavibacteriales bacterium]
MKQQLRIGNGFDIHPFEEGRKLFLGGVEIPHSMGLEGHSDADVILHALCDSLLGALALGDIGKHFPNTDMQYRNIDSKLLLAHTYKLIRAEGYTLCNSDIMVLAEAPKIMKYVPEMQTVIAGILEVETSQISIKATTTEKLGSIGREEGIAAYSVCLLQLQQ